MAEKQKYGATVQKVQTLLQTICNKIECKNQGSDRQGGGVTTAVAKTQSCGQWSGSLSGPAPLLLNLCLEL